MPIVAREERIAIKLQKGQRLFKHKNGTWYLETVVNGVQKRRSPSPS
jgi:hypothetical protein